MKGKTSSRLSSALKTILIVVLSLAALGGIAAGVLFYLRSQSGEVNVYPLSSVLYNDAWASQSETQGRITADRMQSVYISSSQIVNEIYVREGDRVQIGDPLISFDTTLTDMQLKRQEIKIQKLELDLKAAQRELNIINTYRVGSPVIVTQEKNLEPFPNLGKLIPRWGRGVADDPFVFVWNDSFPFLPEEIVNLGILDSPGDADPDAEPVYVPTPSDTVYAVFETREGDSADGRVIDSYMAVCSRIGEGRYSVIITDVPPTYNPLNPIDNTPVDNTVYISTFAELEELKKNARDKITNIQMDQKKAQLEYDTLEYELTNGIVLCKVDGIVKTLNDPEQVTGTSDPVIIVSGGGGYFVTGALSETELSSMHVGDTVNVMSWESYQNYDATIVKISEFPAEDNSYYHYSQGNNNSSLYPFTAAISEDAVLREGEYVNITYTPPKSGGSGIYVPKMFIRSENGQSYVYAEDENHLLEKRAIVTGGTLWGSYMEVLSGLSEEDYVAFPYGKNVKPGAEAKESSIDALYTY